MQKKYFLSFFLLLLSSIIVLAQQPVKPNAVQIYNQIQKLNFLGSVLYIAAHPDDENTRLISYLSNEKKARTAYLSLTRGDGGQNLIGPELRELLGVIRTQELIEARKIDGGEQLFSRANDFGYSKNPEETLRIWDKEQVLSDVIWAIRKFKPDVIINRFDHRSPGTTHGHHTASAILSTEAFDLANNPQAYPNQLALAETWQPRRMLFNTSWWFYGSKEKFDKADKSNLIQLQTGVYYPSIGKSNQEIAALSRSSHQSQGFGNTGTRGEEMEYLEFIKGEIPQDKSNLFEGIDTTWNRVKGGNEVGELLADIQRDFDFKNPSLSVPNLVRAYTMIQSLEEEHWKFIKSEEIKKIIAACTGLYLEAVAENQTANPNSEVRLKVEAINRSAVPMKFAEITVLPQQQRTTQNIELKNNILQIINLDVRLPATLEYTNPYWLKERGTIGMYRVDNQNHIGIPDVIHDTKAIFAIVINGVSIPFERNVVYKYNDDVKGEVYNPFDIVPDVTSSILNKVTIFNNGRTKTIGVKIKAGKDSLEGDLQLEATPNWKIDPTGIHFNLAKKGDEQTVYFEVTPPKMADEITAKSVITISGNQFNKELTNINYEHISKQQVLKPSEGKFIKLDIKTGNEKIAYIMGAGDEVPTSLSQMGYEIIILKSEEITKERLVDFDVVMTGVRAYNTIKALAIKQDILFDFVKEGKTMIVQYNTTDELVTKNIAPFPLKISRDRVTEENAEMRFLVPKHSILNYPNKITAKDFENWKQEQGLNYPSEWDPAFTPILSSNDKGESPKNGAVLVAKYGKGHYIYTGLSFFRELPEGVSGAFRLLANMISIK
ncbi:PIG-L family deacetylase [Flavobacterium sp. GT3R68]|uniref:PIG-L family deacetylase n=1 Tax=Flavobacterium sp. GT3R68 TaxID=2594437 RepID=UPI000F85F9B7|nr:PIG-L family deacetylase [Flavobacterium sp. GT3R68]RTY95038.1 PIG-L family deacetylase [Flavobacterium sp. GSN2]TRW91844.1 PIG-L family deacetylase [Flavobacterium sp. GT3R68]